MKIENARVICLAVVLVGEGGREMTIKRTTTFMFAYFTFIPLELVNVYLRPCMPYAIDKEEGRNLRIEIEMITL